MNQYEISYRNNTTRKSVPCIVSSEGRASPGPQVSKMYSPSGLGLVSVRMVSKVVPPLGARTKRFVIGEDRWEPGRKESAPL